MNTNRTKNYLSSKALNKGNLIFISFVSLLFISTFTLVFIGMSSQKVDAAPSCPASLTGELDSSDQLPDECGYNYVLSNYDIYPEACTAWASDSLQDVSTICPDPSSGDPVFVASPSSFADQIVTDAEDFCENYPSDHSGFAEMSEFNAAPSQAEAREQNDVGALSIIYFMMGTPTSTTITGRDYNPNTYCPNGTDSVNTLENIADQWRSAVESDFAGAGKINWDYCPGEQASKQSPTDANCGYSIDTGSASRVNWLDGPGNDSGKDDTYPYNVASTGSLPGIAFYYSKSATTPDFIIKYFCGNITNQQVKPSPSIAPVSIYGAEYYYDVRERQYDLLSGTSFQIKEYGGNNPINGCGGVGFKLITPSSSSTTISGTHYNFQYNTVKGATFCFFKPPSSYTLTSTPTLKEEVANPMITPDKFEPPNINYTYTNSSLSSNCTDSGAYDEYVYQVANSSNSDTYSGACNYGMTDDYGYDFKYSEYYLSAPWVCNNSDLINITVTSNLTKVTVTQGSKTIQSPYNNLLPGSYTVTASESGVPTLTLSLNTSCAKMYHPYFFTEGGDTDSGIGYGSCDDESTSAYTSGYNNNGAGGAGGQLVDISPTPSTGFDTGVKDPQYDVMPLLSSSLHDKSPLSITYGSASYSNCVTDYYQYYANLPGVTYKTSLPVSSQDILPYQCLVPGDIYNITNLTQPLNLTSNPAVSCESVSNLSSNSASGVYILLVNDQDINITNNITYGKYTTLTNAPLFILIDYGGDINIDYSVKQIQGVYISEYNPVNNSGGTINTCSNVNSGVDVDEDLNSADCSQNTLTVDGSLSANNINMYRSSGDTNPLSPNPAEEYIYSPEVWLDEASTPGGSYVYYQGLPPVL